MFYTELILTSELYSGCEFSSSSGSGKKRRRRVVETCINRKCSRMSEEVSFFI